MMTRAIASPPYRLAQGPGRRRYRWRGTTGSRSAEDDVGVAADAALRRTSGSPKTTPTGHSQTRWPPAEELMPPTGRRALRAAHATSSTYPCWNGRGSRSCADCTTDQRRTPVSTRAHLHRHTRILSDHPVLLCRSLTARCRSSTALICRSGMEWPAEGTCETGQWLFSPTQTIWSCAGVSDVSGSCAKVVVMTQSFGG